MTLTLRDKIIILIIAFVLLFYGGYKLLWIPAGEKIIKLEEKRESVENLSADISPLLQKSEKLRKEENSLKETVMSVKNQTNSVTLTNEEFLVFLGNSAKKNNVDVTGFNDLGIGLSDGIYKAMFDFELRGKSDCINNVLNDIDNIGIKCSFGSVSYRQNEDYDYLKRFFDDISKLPWYEEPESENKEEQVIEEIPEPIPDIFETIIPDIPNDIPEITLPPAENENIIEELPKENEIQENPEINKEESQKPESEKTPSSIEDRLNSLLEGISSKENYSLVLLNNDEYKQGQDMRLAVTVCFIMYNEPSLETSFLQKNDEI